MYRPSERGATESMRRGGWGLGGGAVDSKKAERNYGWMLFMDGKGELHTEEVEIRDLRRVGSGYRHSGTARSHCDV